MQIKHVRKEQDPKWHVIDANNAVLGRLATKTADLLRGKSKPTFVPNMDCGDHVVIINAEKVALTGNKIEQKTYYHHSWFPGGIKAMTAKEALERKPTFLVENAVKGMLPKNKLHKLWMQRLHIYVGSEHPHQANIAGQKETN